MHHNTKDLTGKKFGKLTVVKLAPERLSDNRITWTCKCDCGNSIDRTSHYLNDNRIATHSCGCAQGLKRRIKVKPGTIKGKLTVVSDAPDIVTPNGDRHSALKCKCNCGKEAVVHSAAFRRNKHMSCGNAVCKRQISDEDMLTNKKYKDYKHGAKKRNYSFNLTKDEVKKLILDNCHYCGCEPANIYKNSKEDNTEYKYNGIDRVDNDLGYDVDNVVSCCGKCNVMKMTLNKDEFVNHLKKIVSNLDE